MANELSRRELLSTPVLLSCASAVAQTSDEHYVEAKTVYGRVRGAQSDGLTTFKGIPYAGSVSGANRFKDPPPLKPWTGVRDTLAVGAPAIQPGQRRNEPQPAED